MIETEARKGCFTIAVEDGHRTTLTLTDEDAVEVLIRLREHYGQPEGGLAPEKKPGFFGRLLGRS